MLLSPLLFKPDLCLRHDSEKTCSRYLEEQAYPPQGGFYPTHLIEISEAQAGSKARATRGNLLRLVLQNLFNK